MLGQEGSRRCHLMLELDSRLLECIDSICASFVSDLQALGFVSISSLIINKVRTRRSYNLKV